MEFQGCDRRILKAFYTQYVAVLLIMLTFTIGAFQQASTASAGEGIKPEFISEAAPIGDYVIVGLFGVDGSVPPDEPQLKALASVVRNHDVFLTLQLSVPRLAFEADSSSVRRALRRIHALEQFFISQDVPLTAVRFAASARSTNENDLTVQVTPEDDEVNHGL